MQNISVRHYYDILYLIVDNYYFQTYSDEIGGLAGEMGIAENENITIDPAIWYDWLEAVDGKKTPIVLRETILEDGEKISWYDTIDGEREDELPNKKLTIEEGYNAAIRFLTTYAERLESKDIKEFIKQLTFNKWSDAVNSQIKNISKH